MLLERGGIANIYDKKPTFAWICWIYFAGKETMENVLASGAVKHKIILGIDPGSRVMGYALLEWFGNRRDILCMDAVAMGSKLPIEERLKMLFKKVSELIDIYHPDYLAIEAPFYGKNVQSMLKLGKAQGVAIAAALAKDIPFVEYAPRRIKQSITGKGGASKEQVAVMLQRMVSFRELPKYLDATDALAVAVCHSLQHQFSVVNNDDTFAGEVQTKKSNSWTAFLAANPDRVKKGLAKK